MGGPSSLEGSSWRVGCQVGLFGIFEHGVSGLECTYMPVLVQQHGAPLYISRHTAHSQNQQFFGWWVGRHGKQNWVP
jgi:hypothetical protein